jgi:nucleotidyltransferase substrate binding protein (TIGR01987 family)
LDHLSELEVEGLIQRFEYTYELAWNTLQDLFKHQGYNDVSGPGPVIDMAFKNDLISDAEGWARLRKSRQLTSHTHNKETANEIAKEVIEIYYSLFNQLQIKLLRLKGK